MQCKSARVMPPASASRNNLHSRHLTSPAATPPTRPLAPSQPRPRRYAPGVFTAKVCVAAGRAWVSPILPTRRLSALPLAHRLRQGCFFGIVRHGRSPHPDSLDPRGHGCGWDCVRHFLGARARVSPAGVNLAPMPASRKLISVLLRTRAEVTDWTCSELRSALRTNASCDWQPRGANYGAESS